MGEQAAHHRDRLVLALTVSALALAACGDGGETEPGGDGGAAASTRSSAETILIRTRMVEFSGKVVPGSVLGDAEFCPGGTVSHEFGSPDIGFPAVNVFDCPGGQLQIGFGPGPDQMDQAIQTSEWKVLRGSGEFAGASGEGQMEVRFPEAGASSGRETFTGKIVLP